MPAGCLLSHRLHGIDDSWYVYKSTSLYARQQCALHCNHYDWLRNLLHMTEADKTGHTQSTSHNEKRDTLVPRQADSYGQQPALSVHGFQAVLHMVAGTRASLQACADHVASCSGCTPACLLCSRCRAEPTLPARFVDDCPIVVTPTWHMIDALAA